MAELFLHQRRIQSIFNLLGEKENHITYSLGWALWRFLDAIIFADDGDDLRMMQEAVQDGPGGKEQPMKTYLTHVYNKTFLCAVALGIAA